MRRVVLALFMASFAAGLLAQELDKARQPNRIHYYPPRGAAAGTTKAGGNLSYFGGPVLPSAKAVFIFWGPSFSNVASPDYQYAQTLIAFRSQFGTTPEFNTITQYYQTVGGSNQLIQLTNLAGGTADWFDTSTPPTNVSDSALRAEVQTYLTTHPFDAGTIYEVFLPSTSYVTSGSSSSCGGPRLGFCAYHSYIGSGTNAIKYSAQPWASCGGCQVSGWTAVQNQEHFVTHETREAVTDPLINAWLDRSGSEADDKCAWSPAPFIGTGGFGYQYEWSNAARGCVKTR